MTTLSRVDKTKHVIYALSDGSVIADYGMAVMTYTSTHPPTKVKQSVDTPGFIKGQFRVNPYLVSSTSFSGGDGTVEAEFDYGVYHYSKHHKGALGSYLVAETDFTLPADSYVNYQMDAVLQRAMAKVGQSTLTLGVELGELNETLKMLKSPVKSLRDFFLKNRGENLKLLKKMLQSKGSNSKFGIVSGKTLTETWLEFRYGIQPLVSSIQKIMNEVNAKARKFNQYNIKTCRSSIESSNSSSRQTSKMVPSWYGTVKLSFNEATNTKVIGIVYFREKWQRSTGEYLGVNLASTPEIIWELTRLSFVVDWIFSVGPWLGSYRVQPRIEILGNTCSTRISYKGTCALSGVCQFQPGSLELACGDVLYEKQYFRRYVDRDLPVLPLFRYADGMSILHTVDSVALLLQPLLKQLLKG